MKQIKKILLLILLLASIINSIAQVTIGSGEEPSPGALLDLKQSGTTTKGLLLPRVSLESLNGDLGKSLDANKAQTETLDSQVHVGLTVYNVAISETPVNRRCPGVHVWDGSVWVPLVPYPDPLENKVLRSVSNRNFDFLDPDDPTGWPEDKEADRAANSYALGYIGKWTDDRDNEEYNYTRFYVGYKKRDATYDIQRSYNCDTSTPPNWITEDQEIRHEKIFDDGVWMTQNLRAMKQVDGTTFVLNNKSNKSTTVHQYFYPNNQVANIAREGVLYNWAAAMNLGTAEGKTPFPDGSISEGGPDADDVILQGICPKGWHLSNDQEWTDLERAIIANPDKFSTVTQASDISYAGPIARGDNHGTAMKTTVTIAGYPSQGQSFTSDNGGFEVFLASYGRDGTVMGYGGNVVYWCASAYFSAAWIRDFSRSKGSVSRSASNTTDMYFVRCKKGE